MTAASARVFMLIEGHLRPLADGGAERGHHCPATTAQTVSSAAKTAALPRAARFMPGLGRRCGRTMTSLKRRGFIVRGIKLEMAEILPARKTHVGCCLPQAIGKESCERPINLARGCR